MRRFVWLAMILAGQAKAEGLPLVVKPAQSDPVKCAFKRGGVRFCVDHDALFSRPMIGVDGRYLDLDFRESAEVNEVLGWVGVASIPSTIVGVLDSQVEGLSAQLVVVVSSDGGKTWKRAADVVKPHYMATFRKVELLSATHWRLQVSLDDCADCGVKVGLRRYETKDAGAHWVLKT